MSYKDLVAFITGCKVRNLETNRNKRALARVTKPGMLILFATSAV